MSRIMGISPYGRVTAIPGCRAQEELYRTAARRVKRFMTRCGKKLSPTALPLQALAFS